MFNNFGQWSFSLVHQGVIKAWHGHKIQYQWTYITIGVFKVVIYDTRSNCKTFGNTMEFLMGDNCSPFVYSLPPGVVHGLKCISGPGHVSYITSGQYDLSDELRIPHDDSVIGYDWLKGHAIT